MTRGRSGEDRNLVSRPPHRDSEAAADRHRIQDGTDDGCWRSPPASILAAAPHERIHRAPAQLPSRLRETGRGPQQAGMFRRPIDDCERGLRRRRSLAGEAVWSRRRRREQLSSRGEPPGLRPPRPVRARRSLAGQAPRGAATRSRTCAIYRLNASAVGVRRSRWLDIATSSLAPRCRRG